MKLSLIKKIPLYILLVGCYPVLSLYQLNITELNTVYAVRPFLVSVVIELFLFFALYLIIKNVHKAGIISVGLFIIFSSYGALYSVLRWQKIGSLTWGRHSVLIAIILILFGLFSWWIIKKSDPHLGGITQALNIISIVLVMMPLVQIGMYYAKNVDQQAKTNHDNTSSAKSKENLPDVYYIIMDSYGRADYLKQYMDYDNSDFINKLHDMGFYTVDCGLSNYSFTRLSVSTSLNMNYITALGDQYVPQNTFIDIVDLLIFNSKVVQDYKDAGYKIDAFETGFPFTELKDADHYYQPDIKPLTMSFISPFEELVIENTGVSIIADQPQIKHALGMDFPYYDKWIREHYIVDKLKEIPEEPGPKFTFVHMVTTHRPFIFQADGSVNHNVHYYYYEGEPINDKYFRDGYVDGIEYTNSFLVDVVQTILKNSKVPPVIVIQADHGIKAPGRISILNAILLPGGKDKLYKTLTPVNTFRIINNTILGKNYEILPDHSFYSDRVRSPFLLNPVDNSKACTIQ
jgi:hypothetical protein